MRGKPAWGIDLANESGTINRMGEPMTDREWDDEMYAQAGTIHQKPWRPYTTFDGWGVSDSDGCDSGEWFETRREAQEFCDAKNRTYDCPESC